MLAEHVSVGESLPDVVMPACPKGRPKWHRATDRLFLGIDHTAIVVADTASSLKFYRDRLGMKVVGEQVNFGPEQERLNNVLGARLRITSLRAESGPGVELLEYLSPSDGRPATNTQLNDLVHVETIVKLAGAPRTSIIFDPDHHTVRLAP